MIKPIEKIFIVWGGNQDIADMVSSELAKVGFDGVVGGGIPTNMYIGTQVFSQINQCTRAIILVENTRKDAINPFSSNLMFEWGYLTAKMDPRKLHVFLIGESIKNLPSDLAGIWADEIKNVDDRTREEVAKEITKIFLDAASRPIDIDKISIFNNWNEVKRNLSVYSTNPAYSEIECAHYILHSMEVCYAYMEEEEMLNILEKIVPASSALEFAIQVVKANHAIFMESDGLTKQISFDTLSELKSLFERNFDFTNQDKNLHMWFKFVCYNRLGLLYMFIIRNDDFDMEYKTAYFEKAIECNDMVFHTLKDIADTYPQEAVYTKLYEGYVYRDMYRLNKIMGNSEKMHQYITAAMKAHETFYLYYKQRYPNDGILTKHFGKEYYLDCAEHLKYMKDPIERKITENTIKSFLNKVENDSGRQHVVLKQLRLAFEGKDS